MERIDPNKKIRAIELPPLLVYNDIICISDNKLFGNFFFLIEVRTQLYA